MDSQGSFYETWTAVYISFTCWCGLYCLACLIFSDKAPEYRSRVVTVVHGLFSAIQGTTQCFDDSWTFNEPDKPTNDFQAFLIVFSLGYFMEDLLWCLYYQSESNLMVAHHVYSCVALLRILRGQKSGGQTTCTLGVLEITNPLLQARWFVRSHGMRDSVLFIAVEITFIVTFFIVRIVIGSVVCFLIITTPDNDWEYKFLSTVIYIISWMFMINIAKYINMKYLHGNLEHRLQHIPPS